DRVHARHHDGDADCGADPRYLWGRHGGHRSRPADQGRLADGFGRGEGRRRTLLGARRRIRRQPCSDRDARWLAHDRGPLDRGGGAASGASYDPTPLLDGAHTTAVRSTLSPRDALPISIAFTLDTTTATPTVALTHDTYGAGTAGTDHDLLTKDASLTVSGEE